MYVVMCVYVCVCESVLLVAPNYSISVSHGPSFTILTGTREMDDGVVHQGFPAQLQCFLIQTNQAYFGGEESLLSRGFSSMLNQQGMKQSQKKTEIPRPDKNPILFLHENRN